MPGSGGRVDRTDRRGGSSGQDRRLRESGVEKCADVPNIHGVLAAPSGIVSGAPHPGVEDHRPHPQPVSGRADPLKNGLPANAGKRKRSQT